VPLVTATTPIRLHTGRTDKRTDAGTDGQDP